MAAPGPDPSCESNRAWALRDRRVEQGPRPFPSAQELDTPPTWQPAADACGRIWRAAALAQADPGPGPAAQADPGPAARAAPEPTRKRKRIWSAPAAQAVHGPAAQAALPPVAAARGRPCPHAGCDFVARGAPASMRTNYNRHLREEHPPKGGAICKKARQKAQRDRAATLRRAAALKRPAQTLEARGGGGDARGMGVAGGRPPT